MKQEKLCLMQRCHHFYTYEKMPHRNSNCLYQNASSGSLLRRGRKSQTYVLLSCLLGWVWTTVCVGQWRRSRKLVAPAASHNSKLSPIQEELIRRQESLPYTSADPTQHFTFFRRRAVSLNVQVQGRRTIVSVTALGHYCQRNSWQLKS